MGSSTKKHKEKDREHKKKRRHRSRSNSRERSRERKYRRKEQRSDKQEPEIQVFDYQHGRPAPALKPEPLEKFPAPAGGATEEKLSLSIEEANRLRAKLGLKPLDVKKEGGPDKGKNEDIHAPPVNLAEVKKAEEFREKLAAIKEKRRLNQLLGKVKTLADDDGDDDALAWVKKSRQQEEAKALADKRAKVLEEMDNEFGIGNLVEEEFGAKQPMYSSRDLKGLRVEHGQGYFKEGHSVVLTLKDKKILDEDDDDILINVNMIDDERAKRNVENKLKKPEYKPYDEPEFDQYGQFKPRDVLDKYNEEIGGQHKEYIELDNKGRYNASHERIMNEYKATILAQGETLTIAPPKNCSRILYSRRSGTI